MAHVFLSSEWLDAVEVLQSELPPPERAAPNTAVALKVTDGPDGDTELTLAAGRFRREAAPNPAATLTIDYEVAKALLVDRDRDQSDTRSVVIKAIGAGKYKTDGDQSALAATLSLSPKQVDYSPQQVEVAAKIKELTAEVPRSGFLDDLGSGSITPGEISPALRPRIDELGLEKNCRELAEQGYTVIENVADPELTTRMREYHMAHGAKGNAMLLREDPMFCEAILNPKLLAMVEFSVGRGANISQVSASIKDDTNDALGLHADQGWLPAPFPDHNYLITFCWVHDEFTKEGGATKVVPHSHRERRHPEPGEVEAQDGAIAIEAPFNSVAVWNGSVWHGNWARTIPGERVVTHITYSRLAMKPIEDYSDHADDLIAAHGEQMALLLGREDMFNSPGGSYAAPEKMAATFAWGKT